MTRAFVYAGMVELDGEKMSKSLGNQVLVSQLLRQGAEAVPSGPDCCLTAPTGSWITEPIRSSPRSRRPLSACLLRCHRRRFRLC
ncbi:hypothetical protein [Bacillus sp. B15-48]|uniref:hypothetical protein n=1 Tax=Bacillus sp. B15-48 TaxID=1548601 RepID=UPI0031B83479